MRNLTFTIIVFLLSLSAIAYPSSLRIGSMAEPSAACVSRFETNSAPSTGEQALNNWLCQKCRTLIQSRNKPSSGYCPSGGHHQWNNLGRVGNTVYQCADCGISVESREKPSSAYCPSGGHHRWNRIAN